MSTAEAEIATFGRTTEDLPAITSAAKDSQARGEGAFDPDVGTDECLFCGARRPVGEIRSCEADNWGCGV